MGLVTGLLLLEGDGPEEVGHVLKGTPKGLVKTHLKDKSYFYHPWENP